MQTPELSRCEGGLALLLCRFSKQTQEQAQPEAQPKTKKQKQKIIIILIIIRTVTVHCTAGTALAVPRWSEDRTRLQSYTVNLRPDVCLLPPNFHRRINPFLASVGAHGASRAFGIWRARAHAGAGPARRGHARGRPCCACSCAGVGERAASEYTGNAARAACFTLTCARAQCAGCAGSRAGCALDGATGPCALGCVRQAADVRRRAPLRGCGMARPLLPLPTFPPAPLYTLCTGREAEAVAAAAAAASSAAAAVSAAAAANAARGGKRAQAVDKPPKKYKGTGKIQKAAAA